MSHQSVPLARAARPRATLPIRSWLCKSSTSPVNSSRDAILQRDGYRCVYCQRTLTQEGDTKATIDHIIPQCLFSTFAIANRDLNRVACCLRCNRKKSDWSPTTLSHRAWFDRDYCLTFIAKCVLPHRLSFGLKNGLCLRKTGCTAET